MPVQNNQGDELNGRVVNDLRLHSDSLNELISQKPNFFERWALVLFLFILGLLFSGTWFVRYPDIVRTRATLVATNSPKELIISQAGRLKNLFVQNNQIVPAGSIVGYIESTAKPEQVLLLSGNLDTTVWDLQYNNTQNVVTRFEANLDALGEIQQDYQKFRISFQQFKDYLQDGYYLRKKSILMGDLIIIKKNFDIVGQQKGLLLKDLKLSEESYSANESLLNEKVISKQDVRVELSKLLGKQLNIPQVDALLLNIETQKREKQKELEELEHSISQQKILFQQALQTLQSIVNEWKRKYIIISPINGRITFPIPLQINQYQKSGKIVGFVIPDDTQYYSEIILPQYNFGKLNIGQKVQLRFDAYPFQEFGYVVGELDFISEFATDSGFIAHVRLKNGLVTNQNRILHYRDGLKADAQIIIRDMRLIERFYINLVGAMARN